MKYAMNSNYRLMVKRGSTVWWGGSPQGPGLGQGRMHAYGEIEKDARWAEPVARFGRIWCPDMARSISTQCANVHL